MAWLEYAGGIIQQLNAIDATVEHAQSDPNLNFDKTMVYGRRTSTAIGFPAGRYKRRRFAARRQAYRSGKYRRVGKYGRFSGVNAYRLQVGINEKKWFDTIIDFALGISTTGENSISFLLIPGGPDPEERIGRKARLFSMHVRGSFSLEAVSGAGAGAAESIRLIYILDTQCNGVVPAVTELLEVADINSFLKLENSGRFRIVKELICDLYHPSSAGNGSANDHAAMEKSFKFNLDWSKKPIIVEWGGITGAISTIKSNNLYCMAIGRFGTGSVKINSCVRIRFTD